MIIGYKIKFQRRCPYNGKYPQNDYRAYREFLVWPLAFKTQAMAWAYWNSIDRPFKNLAGRKLTMTVEPIYGTEKIKNARFTDESHDPRNEHRILNAVNPNWDYRRIRA